MNKYTLKNMVTGEIKGAVYAHSMAAASEHFDALYPNLFGSWVIFESAA